MTANWPVAITTSNETETQAFAENLGKQLRGGEIIELIGDVGAGKTTFVKGLTRGIGSSDRVSSPTFTVNNVYTGEDFLLYHYDFYRLEDYEIIAHELNETLAEGKAVVVMEWAEELETQLQDRLRIAIEPSSEAELGRTLKIWLPASYKHITLPT